VTALVNTTAKFVCPTYSDLEPHIQWVKTSHMVEDGTDPMEVTATAPLHEVREGMVQVRSVGATRTPVC
jgi:hypothetical protein